MKDKFTDIVDTAFTATMEERLDEVETGKVDWKSLLGDFYGDFEQELQKAEADLDGERIKVPDEVSDVICPKCGRNLVYKSGRFGRFLACPGWPECDHTQPIVIEMPGKCPKCGGKILKKTSKRGYAYYGCGEQLQQGRGQAVRLHDLGRAGEGRPAPSAATPCSRSRAGGVQEALLTTNPSAPTSYPRISGATRKRPPPRRARRRAPLPRRRRSPPKRRRPKDRRQKAGREDGGRQENRRSQEDGGKEAGGEKSRGQDQERGLRPASTGGSRQGFPLTADSVEIPEE